MMRLPGIEGEPDGHHDEAPDDEAPGEGGGAPLAPGEVHVAALAPVEVHVTALAPGGVVGSPSSRGGGWWQKLIWHSCSCCQIGPTSTAF